MISDTCNTGTKTGMRVLLAALYSTETAFKHTNGKDVRWERLHNECHL
jgi:hypothetical protein